MPIGTAKFRLYRPKIKVGVVESGDMAGNYIYDHGEPVLQQLFERTDAEIEMIKRFRNIDMPKTEWRDVPRHRVRTRRRCLAGRDEWGGRVLGQRRHDSAAGC